MRIDPRARLAGLLAAATVLLVIANLTLTALLPLPDEHLLDSLVFLLFVASFGGVGTVLATMRPDNPIGWIFSGMALALAIAGFSDNYGQYGLLVEPGSLPAADLAAWVGNWIWLVILSPIGFVLLLFPTGHPPAGIWRLAGWALSAGLVGWFFSQAFATSHLSNAGYPELENPLALAILQGLAAPVGTLSSLLIIAGVLLAAASVVVRFRRSVGDERRQMKWLVYTGLTTIVAICIELPLEVLLGDDHAAVKFMQLGMFSSLGLIPIAIGVAVLRYRLYDIDLLINRTLVYGVLTAILGSSYVAVVTLAGTVLEGSPLVTATATLAVAALFRPLRRRIQGFIDRRFYRRRYDATQTAEAFSSRLRHEVELDAVHDQLLAAVQETMQPRGASLWLKSS